MALRDYLSLVRPANLWTAPADVAAGAAVALGAVPAPARFFPAAAASVCLYAAGTVLNDLFDIERDRVIHPYRPLPAGRVKRSRAALLGAGLTALGLLSACAAGRLPALAALLLAASIFLYDALLSHSAAGPVAMAACRWMNVLLGATLAGGVAGRGFAAAGLVGLYTAGISLCARRERAPERPGGVLGASSVCLAAAVGVPVAAGLAGADPLPAAAFAAAAVLWTGSRLISAMHLRTTPAVVALVRTLILALPILDGGLVAAFVGWRAGAAVAVLALPAWLLGRRFRMT